MRFVALALILISLPVFIALLNKYRDKRDWALVAMGVLMFLIGSAQADAAVISWRLWDGTLKGVFLSPMDSLAIALIVTRRGVRHRTPYLGLVLLYLVPSTLSIFVSPVPMASSFAPLMILRMIIMYVALAGELQRPMALGRLMTGVAIGLLIQGGYVVQQKLSGVVQARGTTDHQNILGMMVEMSLIPLLAMVMEGERRKIIYAGIIAGLIVVAGGGSRATMGFTALGLVMLIILSMIRRPTAHKGKIIGLGALVAVVVVPLGFATLEDRFGSRAMTTEDEVRGSMEEAARMMAAENPLGVGANTFVLGANSGGYYQRAGVPWGGTSLAAPVHNSFLLMRAETGWFGEIVMIAMLVIPAVAGFRLAFKDRRSPIMGMGLASTVVMIVTTIHCNFEYAWHLEAVQRFYFMNIAILAACVVFHRQAQAERKRRLRTPAPAQRHQTSDEQPKHGFV